jgi:AraC family transcriptional regulator of adaptative response/methylated-DNA-[protein]-cysteine methyltransferase
MLIHNKKNNEYQFPIDISAVDRANIVLKSVYIDTPLGPMIAIADTTFLYTLEFIEKSNLKLQIERLAKKLNATIILGTTPILKSIEDEITQYFCGKNAKFKTPLKLIGTCFQKDVWNKLIEIPLGETKSYLELSKAIKKPTAFRAVAQANGANQLAVIIPCHRVINANGKLGGYSSGVARKQWLLEHERKWKHVNE